MTEYKIALFSLAFEYTTLNILHLPVRITNETEILQIIFYAQIHRELA